MSICRNSAFGRGASISLEFPAVIGFSHPLYGPWKFKTLTELADILAKDKIRPYDTDAYGYSVLFNSLYNNGQNLRFLNFLLRYYGIYPDQITDRRVACQARYLIDRGKVDPGDETGLAAVQAIVRYDNKQYPPDSKIHLSLREHGDVTEAILQEPWAIDSWDRYGETPLTVACWDSNVEGVRTLIAAKANVDLPNFEGDSPLNAACYSGAVECVKTLILAQCDISCSRALFFPIFDCVLSSTTGTVQALETLLNHDASASPRDKVDQGTPLHFLADGPGVDEKLTLLLAKGADINARDVEERTPLHRAIWGIKCVVVKLLLQANASTKAITCDSWSTFSYLAAYGNSEIMQVFIDAQDCEFPDHELRDKWGRTALDIFKWRLCSEDLLKDMQRPTSDEVAAFQVLYRKVRNHQLQSNIALARSAVNRLHEYDGSGANENLQPLCDRKMASRDLEDVETLRVIGLQIRNEMWDAAIESLQEIVELWAKRIRIAPLQDWSPCFGPVTEIFYPDGYAHGILGRYDEGEDIEVEAADEEEQQNAECDE